MPVIVTAAFANDLKPAIDAHRRLIARWSCATMLFARHACSNGGERFSKECLCGRDSAVSAQEEVDRQAVFVDGTVKVVPAAADGNIRCIHSPGCPVASRESAPAFLVLRHISENPSKVRGVCDADPALSH